MPNKKNPGAMAIADGVRNAYSGKSSSLKPTLRTHRKQVDRVDFARIRRAALAAMPDLIFRLLPGGKLHGVEYVVRNPHRRDRWPGSFSINVCSGRWADFSLADARGGDITSLLAYLDGTSQGDAARRLAQLLGLTL